MGGVPVTKELVDPKRDSAGYRLITRSTLETNPGTGESESENCTVGSPRPDDKNAA